MLEPPVQFFELCATLLAPRSNGGLAFVESIGRPYGLQTLSRWLQAALIDEQESTRLLVLSQGERIDESAVRRLLTHEVAPDRSESFEWTASEDGDATLPDFAQPADNSSSFARLLWSESSSGSHASISSISTYDLAAGLANAPGLDDKPAHRFQFAERQVRTRIFDVYAGRDLLMGRNLSLHLHRQDGPLNRNEFITAVRRQARFQHPNMQQVYEMGLDASGVPFYATACRLEESMHGVLRSLAYGEGKQWTRLKLLEALWDVSRALLFAHQSGLIHRDVRPSEIFLGYFGQVELAGWFRSRLISEAPSTVIDSALNDVSHGLGYLAPERLEKGLSACGQEADVWGLGALLYGILTLCPPLAGRSSSEILKQCAEEGVVPPSERARHADIPQALEDLCMSALVVDPVQRTMTAAIFASELQAYLDGTRAEERRLNQAEAILDEAETAARHYMEARERLHQAWRAEAELRCKPSSELRKVRARLQNAQEETERWFHKTNEAYMNTMATLPRYEPARRGLCALYFRALQDVQAEQIKLPSSALEASIRQIEPVGSSRFFNAPASLDFSTDDARDEITLFEMQIQNGVQRVTKQVASAVGHLYLESVPAGMYIATVVHNAMQFIVDFSFEPGVNFVQKVKFPDEVPEGFVFVPGGPCVIGRDGEEGSRLQALPHGWANVPGFFAGAFLVTLAEYFEFLRTLPDGEAMRRLPRRGNGPQPCFMAPDINTAVGQYRWSETMPAIGLSYDDVLAYIAWRSARDGRKYRLLTEIEWEKLARGASGRRYPWGDLDEPSFVGSASVSGTNPCEVGTHPYDRSVYGAYDLSGCAREYTATNINRRIVLRGGTWYLPFTEAELVTRTLTSAASDLLFLGFRLALDGPEGCPPVEICETPDWVMNAGPDALKPTQSENAGFAQDELTLEGHTVLGSMGPPPPPRLDWSVDLLELGPKRYSIIEEIAHGSMGRVVLAYDNVLERHVALKILHEKHRQDRLSRYRFAMDARITGRLQHPAMVPIYDMGVLEDGLPFFAMKPVAGQSLQEILQGRAQGDRRMLMAFPLDRLLTLMRRICFGVAFANQAAVVHRDLKPANILIGSVGEVLIVDLGLARQMNPDPSDKADILEAIELSGSDGRVTRAGSVIGTPYYMSPEQAMGLQDMVTELSDVYGLGAILYHMLAHRPPFAGKKVNEVLAKVRRGHPLPPSQVAPQEEISPELDEIVLKALSLDPKQRPTSALELAESLAHLQDKNRLELQVLEVAESRAKLALQAYQKASEEREQLDPLLAQIKSLRNEIADADPVERRMLLFRARQQLEEQYKKIEQYIVEAVTLARLSLNAGNDAIRPHLAMFLQTRYLIAENAKDRTSQSWYARMIRAIDTDGQFEHWLTLGASLSLETRPSGLPVTIKRTGFVPNARRADERSLRAATPMSLTEIPQGTGVCTVAMQGQTIKLPFQIHRSKSVVMKVNCPRDLRGGFAFIAEGAFWYGGDPLLDEGLPARSVALPSFCISVHPVTYFDYQEWLEDLQRNHPEEYALRLPRITPNGPPMYGPIGQKLFGGFAPYRPVTGITLRDAHAYAHWRAKRDGVPYRLPSSAEWEKAARGVDGRKWPWGDYYEPSFCRNENPFVGDIGSFPEDCSPYGVQDLATGVMEWTLTSVRDQPRLCYLRGCCSAIPSHPVACVSRTPWPPEVPSPFIGFRLAYSVS